MKPVRVLDPANKHAWDLPGLKLLFSHTMNGYTWKFYNSGHCLPYSAHGHSTTTSAIEGFRWTWDKDKKALAVYYYNTDGTVSELHYSEEMTEVYSEWILREALEL